MNIKKLKLNYFLYIIIIYLYSCFAFSATLSVEDEHDLGVKYLKGDGVELDKKKGRLYIHQSALRGYPLAQFHLGLLFYRGEGGDKSHHCAQWWFLKAANSDGEIKTIANQAINEMNMSSNIVNSPFDDEFCTKSPALNEEDTDISQKKSFEGKENLSVFFSTPDIKSFPSIFYLYDKFGRLIKTKIYLSFYTLSAGHKLTPLVNNSRQLINEKKNSEKIQKVKNVVNTAKNNNVSQHLINAPSSRFTLQLSSASNPEGLKKVVNHYDLKNYVIYQTTRNNRKWYVLVYGEFFDIPSARKGIKSLPQELQKNQPWPRRIKDVHIELKNSSFIAY